MKSDSQLQPIDLAERRTQRRASGDSATLTSAQLRAYRQLAIAALGLDVPTLTRTLRARRLQATPQVADIDQAA